MENDIKLENSARKLAMWGWIAFVTGWIIPIAPIAGLVIGYVGRSKYEGTKTKSEFIDMISMFWIALACAILSFVLTAGVIGYIGFVIIPIYVTVKAVKGIIRSTSDNDNVSATHTTSDPTAGVADQNTSKRHVSS